MATTASAAKVLHNHPFTVTQVDLTTINPGETLDVSHGGPTGAPCAQVRGETIVEATSGDPIISLEHIVASDSTTNDPCRLRVKTIAGGNLAGATLRVFFTFYDQGSGGLS